MRQADVERVAETHFMIRPALVRAPTGTVITEEGQNGLGDPTRRISNSGLDRSLTASLTWQA